MINMKVGTVHESLKPLSWLIGKWQSTVAEGFYPTIEPFAYCEELAFESVGQPILNYSSRTWHKTKLNPMHFESGFLRINPGTTQIAFMIAHNFGITTLEEGNVLDRSVKLKSVHINRMSFAKEPAVTEITRDFKLNEDGTLELALHMATSNTQLCQHLKVVYEKVV